MTEIQELHENLFLFLEHLRRKDQELYYSLRQDNFGGRLEEGYWFQGTDKDLYISFWKGQNWITKEPNISLQFDLEHSLIYLSLSIETTIDNKINFVEDILIQELNFQEKIEHENHIDYKYRLGPINHFEDVIEIGCQILSHR